MPFYCYILECANGAYYTGWTKNPIRRLNQHNTGKGASYTRLNRPTRLVYIEEVDNVGSALRRELEIKRLDHQHKAKLISESPANILPSFLNNNIELACLTRTVENFTVIAPGRVNLLGEHIDYNDGIVLPIAIDRAITLKVTAISEPILHLKALDFGKEVDICLNNLEQKVDVNNNPLPGFALYPAGVAWALKEKNLEVRGMEAAYTSNIPIGAGLSSSAAVEVAFALAWKTLGAWDQSRMTLAQLCQQAENLYVGVQSGLMDQFASLFGVKGHVLEFDTRSLEWDQLKLPPRTAIIIADSGIRRNLASSAYNDRRADCEEALKLLKVVLPRIDSLRDVTPLDLIQNLQKLPVRIAWRAQHVVGEIERVKQGIYLLRKKDGIGFGQLMYASHASLRDLFEVSTPELDSLVRIASEIPGCLGARLTGAGFSGCTVNLVDRDAEKTFVKSLASAYRKQMGKEPAIYVCRAGQGAHIVA